MADPFSDRKLEQLLGFHEPRLSDEFVAGVMHRVRREQYKRQLILALFGLVGATFGLAGAILLSDSISRIFASLPLSGTVQAALVGVAAVAFYGWIMNEDISLAT